MRNIGIEAQYRDTWWAKELDGAVPVRDCPIMRATGVRSSERFECS